MFRRGIDIKLSSVTTLPGVGTFNHEYGIVVDEGGTIDGFVPGGGCNHGGALFKTNLEHVTVDGIGFTPYATDIIRVEYNNDYRLSLYVAYKWFIFRALSEKLNLSNKIVSIQLLGEDTLVNGVASCVHVTTTEDIICRVKWDERCTVEQAAYNTATLFPSCVSTNDFFKHVKSVLYNIINIPMQYYLRGFRYVGYSVNNFNTSGGLATFNGVEIDKTYTKETYLELETACLESAKTYAAHAYQVIYDTPSIKCDVDILANNTFRLVDDLMVRAGYVNLLTACGYSEDDIETMYYSHPSAVKEYATAIHNELLTDDDIGINILKLVKGEDTKSATCNALRDELHEALQDTSHLGSNNNIFDFTTATLVSSALTNSKTALYTSHVNINDEVLSTWFDMETTTILNSWVV